MFATLNGEILSDAAWSFTVGTSPHVARIEVPADVARGLAESAVIHEAVLVIEDEQQGRLEVRGLTILGTAPTDSPFTLDVLLADQRWVWNRKHVHRRYNMRRRTGAVRRADAAGFTPRQAQDLIPDIEYAPWSLLGGRDVWKPEEILFDVLRAVVVESGVAAAGADNKGFFVRDKDRVLTGAVPLAEIESLEITGPGDAAIAQALAAVGGVVSIYVGADGRAVLFDRLSDKERGLVGAPFRTGAGGITLTKDTPERAPLITDAPVWSLVDRRMERPSKVRVLFERAIELRMDFDETPAEPDSTGTRGSLEANAEPATLENVLQLPEDISQDLINTTWVSVQRYLDFLKGKTLVGLPDLTKAGINEKWLSPALNRYADPEVDPSGLWARRIAPFRQHYRRTFRLKRPWIDRINGMTASRVAIQDQESHARARSPVYQDYAEWVTWRHGGSKGRTANDGPAVNEIVRNRFGGLGPKLPSGSVRIVGNNILSLVPAPAVLRILDQDQGLIQVDFVFDYEGESVRYTRSAVKDLNMPSEDAADQSILLQYGELRDNFQLSTIVTVQPASPNDNRRLHAHVITHEEASALLPGGALASREERADGPVYEIKVSKIPARFDWNDDRAEDLHKAFALGQDPDIDLESDLPDLFGLPINFDELAIFARAVAASVYSGFRDRVVGGLTTGLVPTMEPEGTAQSVTHAATMGINGGALTTVDLPEDAEKRDVMSLLPPDLRRLVDRFVDL